MSERPEVITGNEIAALDDSFASNVAAIAQGRRIFDNITKATRFTFAVHLPIIALALLPALLHWPVLLLPVHIVLLELLIDPACSIVFEAEAAAPDIMTRPPRASTASPFSIDNVGYALTQGLGVALVLPLGYAVLQSQGWAEDDLRTTVFTGLVIGLTLIILANRDLSKPRLLDFSGSNPWLPRMFAGVGLILLAVLLIPFLRKIMGFAAPTVLPLVAAVALAVIVGLWLRLLGWIHDRRGL